VGAALLAGPAVAGSELFDLLSACTTPNCSSQQVTGNVHRSNLTGSVGHRPWVAQIFKGGGNECLRVAVITQSAGTDMAATLTCPGGITWRDDDSNGSFRPLIKATIGTRPGWCTLTIQQFDGSNIESRFSLRFGRYSPADQANCTPPTPPLVASVAPAGK
jgi:hypothetical protein